MITQRTYTVTFGLQTPDGRVAIFQEAITATSFVAATVKQYQELWNRMCHSTACAATGHGQCQEVDPALDVWNFWVADENGNPVWAEEPADE